MRKNTYQKNSEYGHFLRSDCYFGIFKGLDYYFEKMDDVN